MITVGPASRSSHGPLFFPPIPLLPSYYSVLSLTSFCGPDADTLHTTNPPSAHGGKNSSPGNTDRKAPIGQTATPRPNTYPNQSPPQTCRSLVRPARPTSRRDVLDRGAWGRLGTYSGTAVGLGGMIGGRGCFYRLNRGRVLEGLCIRLSLVLIMGDAAFRIRISEVFSREALRLALLIGTTSHCAPGPIRSTELHAPSPRLQHPALNCLNIFHPNPIDHSNTHRSKSDYAACPHRTNRTNTATPHPASRHTPLVLDYPTSKWPATGRTRCFCRAARRTLRRIRQ